MGERAQTAAVAPTDPSRVQSAHRAIKLRDFETYIGFIATLEDALLVVEATINGSLPHFIGTAGDLNLIPCRSGTVIVVAEASAKVRRWKDGVPWSPSRAFGPFLLYRQIELESSATQSHLPKYTARRFNSNHAGLEPNYTRKTLKPGTRISPTGLTKRRITLIGSDGGRHRLVSYYKPSDIVDLLVGKEVHAIKSELPDKYKLLKIPSDDPGLNRMLGNATFQRVLAANRKSGALARSTYSGAVRIPGIAEMLREAAPGIQKYPLSRLDNAELDQALVQELRLVKPNNPSPIRHPENEYCIDAFKGHHYPFHPSLSKMQDQSSPVGVDWKLLKHAFLFCLTLSSENARVHEDALRSYSPQLAWTLKCGFNLGLAGFATGGLVAGRARSHQFLAENAHRLPSTERGWFLYHRHKQLEAMRAGLTWRGGFGAGLRFAGMGVVFTCTEALIENTLFGGRETWAAAVGAGVGSGLVFAAGARLPRAYARYAILFGAGAGLGIGLLEDVAAVFTGVSVKNPMRVREGSLDLWVPGWDWERGVEGVGVFRRQA
ncbi:hypothetical protein HDU80_009463 [Chytriomyces hyalinus]|nr:hypothetical protein HDU80_009463 [Chytriomyces hyalinus]